MHALRHDDDGGDEKIYINERSCAKDGAGVSCESDAAASVLELTLVFNTDVGIVSLFEL